MENLSTVFCLDDTEGLRLCAGDFFPLEIDSLKDGFLLRILERLRLDAFLPGGQDFPRLEKLAEAGFPLVCANLQAAGEKILPAYIEERVKGHNVAITGLWSEETFALLPDSLKQRCSLEPTDIVLNEMRTQTGNSADIWIVMTQGPRDFDLELMQRFNWIDLLISAGRYDTIDPFPAGGGYIAPAGRSCEYAGRASLTPGIKPAPVDFEITALFLQEPVPLPEFKALADEYYTAWYRELEARRAAMPDDGRIFHGGWYCKKCHQREYESWAETPHARAFAALGENPEKRCIPCHTTGFGYPTGFWDLDFSPKMAGVGCEMCHQLPRMSAITGFHPVEPITPESCGCHKPPHDIDFDFSTAVVKVLH